jgi:very-short-patch-repair endonuclease
MIYYSLPAAGKRDDWQLEISKMKTTTSFPPPSSSMSGKALGEGVESPSPAQTPNQGQWRTSPELWAKLKPLARQMRHEPTPAEQKLWQRLRGKQLMGLKFRRQHPIDRFIVDFYCRQARLVVEVDGPIHDYTVEEDAIRQEFIEFQGLRVLRFTNDQVLREIEAVLAQMAVVVRM